MAPEEINQIPKRCDEPVKMTDAPGVTVSNEDLDDKDGQPAEAALQQVFEHSGRDHLGQAGT